MSFLLPPSLRKRRTPHFQSARNKRAFSLVEVVFSLGVFSVAMLPLLGLMATGLNAVSASNNSFAVANITRSLRSNYQAMGYTNFINASGVSQVLSTHYYSNVGNATNASDPTYFTVTCTPMATYNTGASLMNSTNAAVLSVSIVYPYPANAQTNTVSLFLAH